MSHVGHPPTDLRIVDTHAHLDDEAFEADLDSVLARAREGGVAAILTIGTDRESSAAAVALADTHEAIYAVVGVHPHSASRATQDDLGAVKAWADHPKVVAVGEIGLDYHYDFSPPAVQAEVFRSQLEIASEVGLPFVIHNREADEDVLRILSEHAKANSGRLQGVLHCFNGSAEAASRALEMGLHLSVGGMITFRKLDELRYIIAGVPLDRLLVETDCPYLAPEPHRGKRNEPAYTRFTVERLAQVKGLDVPTITRVTTENAVALFGLNLMS